MHLTFKHNLKFSKHWKNKKKTKKQKWEDFQFILLQKKPNANMNMEKSYFLYVYICYKERFPLNVFFWILNLLILYPILHLNYHPSLHEEFHTTSKRSAIFNKQTQLFAFLQIHSTNIQTLNEHLTNTLYTRFSVAFSH